MAGRIKKVRTTQEILDGWIAGQVKTSYEQQQEIRDRFHPGMESHITVGGLNYERFDVDGGYVVMEWSDEGGTIGVC